ncbi:rhodanese domain-containing protein CG4456-like isoform X1 [Odontomachus brunneus]|uniref:rhodanese domain-containing protein CG4456-like isoform X1 n=2 Tax=Odontomachus brunneus TaxID=486640 RepID=UPI0013F1B673|nr:rhodanese domain-containing protein CG4456-like isoform X1 [Odontomachus brunneus]
MYTRFSRRFCKKFVSLITSCKNEHVSTSLGYWKPSIIISDRSISNLTRSLYFSNLSFREVSTTAIMSSQDVKFNVSYEQLLEAQKDDSVLIIDVREQAEINKTGKLPGSIHVPMGSVSSTLQILSEEDFVERYGKPKPTKHTKIIFSCMSGKRSRMVQGEVQKLGYDNVYNYSGGWTEWESKQKS